MADVVHVVADGALGGGTTHVLQILRALVPDTSVALITQGGSPLAIAAARLGVDVRSVDLFAPGAWFRGPRDIARNLRELGPTVVHAHGVRAARSVRASRAVDGSMVYTVHGLHHLRRGVLAQGAISKAHKRAMADSSVTVFVCRHDLIIADALGLTSDAPEVQVIYNASDVRSDGTQEKTWDVGFVGRFVAAKDPELFARAVALVPNLRGVMVGGGPLFAQVDALVQELRLSDRLTLLGARSHEDTLEIMRRCRVLVLTSRHEGLPLACCEAAALGVPVVAASVGGVPEVVRDGETGLLIRGRAPADFARAIQRILEDGDALTSMAEASKRLAEAELSEEAMMSRLLRTYQRAGLGVPA